MGFLDKHFFILVQASSCLSPYITSFGILFFRQFCYRRNDFSTVWNVASIEVYHA